MVELRALERPAAILAALTTLEVASRLPTGKRLHRTGQMQGAVPAELDAILVRTVPLREA